MKSRDPEEMRTVEDLKKLGELEDGVAQNEYGTAFHKLSKHKQERVEKLAEKMFYGEK